MEPEPQAGPTRQPLHARIDGLLLTVSSPARYADGEWNAIRKDPRSVRLRVALAYPGLYDRGTGQPALDLLYGLLNRDPEVAAERVFLPDRDLEAVLGAERLPLFTLETCTPLAQHDLVHFCLDHPLQAVNLVAMLDLAGIPPLAADRQDSHPLILAGGPPALTPEPLAELIDVFLIGELEDVAPALVEQLKELAAARLGRRDRVLELARRLEGAYAPAFYRPAYDLRGRSADLTPAAPGLPERIRAARVLDFEHAYLPDRPVVAGVRTDGDRIHVEIARGAAPGAPGWREPPGVDLPPGRWRSSRRIVAALETLYTATGHKEICLAGASAAHHPELTALVAAVRERFAGLRVNLSVAGLPFRDQLRLALPLRENGRARYRVRPEESTPALAARLGRPAARDDLASLALEAFASDVDVIEVHGVVGVPGETDHQVRALGALAHALSAAGRRPGPRRGRVELTIAPLVPWPHSIFERDPMASSEALERKLQLVREGLGRRRHVRVRWRAPALAFVECVLGRGERHLATALVQLARSGCRLTGDLPPGEAEDILRRLAGTGAAEAHIFSPAETFTPWNHVDTAAGGADAALGSSTP